MFVTKRNVWNFVIRRRINKSGRCEHGKRRTQATLLLNAQESRSGVHVYGHSSSVEPSSCKVSGTSYGWDSEHGSEPAHALQPRDRAMPSASHLVRSKHGCRLSQSYGINWFTITPSCACCFNFQCNIYVTLLYLVFHAYLLYSTHYYNLLESTCWHKLYSKASWIRFNLL